MRKKILTSFPPWLLATGFLSFCYPAVFQWIRVPLALLMIAIVMAAMGLSLGSKDLRALAGRPQLVFYGLVLQYALMPCLAWAIASLFHLSTTYATGLILLACCPSAITSNFVCYIARADLALCIGMTAISNVLALLLTSILTTVLVGSPIEVPVPIALGVVLGVVVLPALFGALLRWQAPSAVQPVLRISPALAMALMAILVGSVVGNGKDMLLRAGPALIEAVLVLHAGSFLGGYFLGLLLCGEPTAARTIALQVGMRNSGLGVLAAMQNFPSPSFAFPSAISSIFHMTIGSLLASFWRSTATSPDGRVSGSDGDLVGYPAIRSRHFPAVNQEPAVSSERPGISSI